MPVTESQLCRPFVPIRTIALLNGELASRRPHRTLRIFEIPSWQAGCTDAKPASPSFNADGGSFDSRGSQEIRAPDIPLTFPCCGVKFPVLRNIFPVIPKSQQLRLVDDSRISFALIHWWRARRPDPNFRSPRRLDKADRRRIYSLQANPDWLNSERRRPRSVSGRRISFGRLRSIP
jgi:hypothetical protein